LKFVFVSFCQGQALRTNQRTDLSSVLVGKLQQCVLNCLLAELVLVHN